MSQSLGLLSFSHSPLSASSAALRRHFTVLIPPPLPRFLRPQRTSPDSPALPNCSLGSTVAGVPLLHDAGATAALLVGAYSLVFTFDSLTQRKIIQQVSLSSQCPDTDNCRHIYPSFCQLNRDRFHINACTVTLISWKRVVIDCCLSLSRKLVHILSGLLFMASWPIFSNSTEARYFASFVPSVNCLRLLVNGLALVNDEGLVKSVSREGNPEELLRGPLFYVLVLIMCTVLFWRESPTGIISLAMMCGGDGIADIAGRRFGSQKLPYNHQKSWVGSISMFGFGFLVSIGMLYYFSSLGYFELDWVPTICKVALISLVATTVESFSTSQVIDDNISVPLASMLTAFLAFGY